MKRETAEMSALLTRLGLVAVMGVMIGIGANAEPVGTAFTYQGQLQHLGMPVEGLADFEFTLHDGETSPVMIGVMDPHSGVSVVNGLFTVQLDFGDGVFNGEARWLEIAVRFPHDPTGAGSLTTLAPRQALTATPYALNTRGLRVDDGGNIGIGTDSPESPLHIVSDVSHVIYSVSHASSGSAVFSLMDATSGTGTAVSGWSHSPNGTGVRGVAGQGSGRAYGVYGLSDSSEGTGVYGEARAGSGRNFGVYGKCGSSSGYAGYFKGSQSYFEGKVGIGVESPSYQLEVESYRDRAISATGKRDTSRGVYAYVSHLTGTNYGIYGETASPNGYAGYFKGGRNYFGGNVGIGTASPGAKLDLAGANANIRSLENGGSPYVELGDTTEVKGYLQWWSPSDRLLLYAAGHAYPVAIGSTVTGGLFVDAQTNGSNVGIATESPVFKLHVNGSAGKPGGGTWSISSDRRLKKNIRDLDGSLDRLMQLRGVSYEYKAPESINELPGTQIGMIAQEVEDVFPDWVSEGEHGYKTLTFRGFESLTVEALRDLRREQDHRLAGQENRLSAVERENTRLREQNADLESRMAQLEALVAELAAGRSGGKERRCVLAGTGTPLVSGKTTSPTEKCNGAPR